MSNLTGRFEMISSENYGEYLRAVGVSTIQRNLAEKSKPTLEITSAGGKWTIKTLSALKNTEITFTPGEDFDEQTPDGRQSKSTVTIEGSRLIHVQRIGGSEATTVSEFGATEMKQTYTTGGVTATRVFRRL